MSRFHDTSLIVSLCAVTAGAACQFDPGDPGGETDTHASTSPTTNVDTHDGSSSGQETTSSTASESGDASGDTGDTGDTGVSLRVPELPPVPPLPIWPDNPATEAKHLLGHMLFADPRLSSSRTVSCGSCHSPVAHFQSNTPRDLPARSLPEIEPPLARNTPSLLNIVYATTLHWDGSESDLYESMVLPFAEANMNLTNLPRGDVWTLDVPTARIQLKQRLTEEIPGYVTHFRDAFDIDIRTAQPEEVWLLAGKALAVFIRVAVSKDAPFDRWNAGDDTAISADAVAGLELFRGKGRCMSCHHGAMFSDFDFHNLSLVRLDDQGAVVDEGRSHVTKDPRDHGRFLTPSLRHVTKTSPFFHDGAEVALINVIAHHTNGGALTDPNHDPLLDEIEPFTDAELAQMIAFLKTLMGEPLDAGDIGTMPPLPE